MPHLLDLARGDPHVSGRKRTGVSPQASIKMIASRQHFGKESPFAYSLVRTGSAALSQRRARASA